VRATLARLKAHFPGYAGQGYELAGFVWFHGWNDMIDPAYAAEYAANLAHLIRDVRKDLKSPGLPFVVGQMWVGGLNPDAGVRRFQAAQAAVLKVPEFKGNVALVRTDLAAGAGAAAAGAGRGVPGRARVGDMSPAPPCRPAPGLLWRSGVERLTATVSDAGSRGPARPIRSSQEVIMSAPTPRQCRCPDCGGGADHPEARYHRDLSHFLATLNAQQRQLYAAVESRRLGRGGVSKVAQVMGLCEQTVPHGRRQLADLLQGKPPE